MSYATIDDLRSQLGTAASSAHSPEYVAKMLHDLPPSAVVDRRVFLLQKVAGQRVLEFGASGPMHDAIVKAAKFVTGVDRQDGPGVIGFDLDRVADPRDASVYSVTLPQCDRYDETVKPDVIICGEVLEHLCNPGWFLQRLKSQYAGIPVVITVPNAFSDVARTHLKKGRENVNIDHVAWYSPRTLRTLVERYGFSIREFAYYNGDGPTAEGLIVVVE